MENFENLNAFDLIPDLPNELLNLSPFVQVFSPIHSPDTFDTQLNEIQPAQIPISSNQTESFIKDKSSPDSFVLPFQPLDLNSNQTRPKRAAAVAANFWISSLKRKGTFDESDKENEYSIKSSSKTNLAKKRKGKSKKKSCTIFQSKETFSNQENFILKETEIEKRLREFLNTEQIQPINSNLGDIPIEFFPNNQLNEELSLQGNENLNLLYANLDDPFINNVVNPEFNTDLDFKTDLNTPTKIDKSMVFCLSDNMCYDDSNYEKDDLGFTISRAVEPNFEQQTYLEFNLDIPNEPLLDFNNNFLPFNNQQFSFDQNKTEFDTSENLFYGGVDLLKLNCGKRADKLVGYAVNVIKVLFSLNEIKHGIFPDNDGKNRSKSRIPFDTYRTEILKKAIIKKFKYNPLSLEKLWINIRPSINRCLKCLTKDAKF